MKFTLDTQVKNYHIRSAILLYGSSNPREKSFSFASMHGVSTTIVEGVTRLEVLAGTPATKEGLISALGSIAEEYEISPGIFPTTLLSHSQLHAIWWVPASKRSIYFKSESVGTVSKEVAQPPLLFMVLRGKWYVYALKSNRRPTATTPLYHAPHFNMYADGSVCVGTAATPNSTAISSLPQWEDAFFNSVFTHMNDKYVRRTKHAKSDSAFWREYMKKSGDKFPADMLVKTEKTVGSLLSQLQIEEK